MSRPPYGERARRTLQVAVRISGVKLESLDRALGMSKGYLSQVFSGRIELKMWHLEVILERLDFEPRAFFRLAYPAPGEEDGSTMEQFTAYTGSRPLRRPAAALPPELRAAIEETVREALAGGGPPPEGEPGGGRRPAARGRRRRPAR